MIASALLCALSLTSAAPDVVFLGRGEIRASTRSNSVDVLTPAFDLAAEPGLQLSYNTRKIESQLVLTPSLSARVSTDSETPVQPLFSQRVDGTFSIGREERSLRLVASAGGQGGLIDVNTAEERLGQPFGLNLGAGAVPLVDANARLGAATRPFRDLRFSGFANAAFLAAPAADALGGGVALGDDIVKAFTTLVPQLRPSVGVDVTHAIDTRLNIGAALTVDGTVDPDALQYTGALAIAQATWFATRTLTTQVQAGGLVAAVNPLPSLSIWPVLRFDATLGFGAPETLLPGGGSLGGGRSSFSVSTGLEPEFDPFLVQVNWQGRLDLAATYAPSTRLEMGLGAGVYARLLATLPPKDGSQPLASEIGIPNDNGANQIGVLTARVAYAVHRQLSIETGILGTARLSATGQTAPQVSIYVAFNGQARDDDAIDLVGDVWRNFY